jgi:ATP-binding cassette subfamily C protein CydD
MSTPPPPERRLLASVPAASRGLWLAVAAGFAAAVVVIGAAIILSLAVAAVFIDGRSLADVAPLLGLLTVAAVLRGGLVLTQEILAQRAAGHLIRGLRDGITARLLDLGPAWISEERTGELAAVLSDGLTAIDDWATTFAPARLLAGAVPLLVLIVVAVLDPPTTAVLLFTGPILILLLSTIGARTRAVSQRRFLELRWLSAFFLDMLRGISTLKMFGRSREQVANMDAISRRYGETTMEVLRTTFQTSLVLEWGGAVAMALVAVEVSLRLMADSLTFERALAVLVVTPEFFLPLRQLAVRYHAGTAGRAAAERVLAILEAPTQVGAFPAATRSPAVAPATTSSAATVPSGDVVFEGVTFSYPGRALAAVDHLDLVLPRHRRIALVGETGAGKSTVVRLLLRFIEPDSGRILVDGEDLTGIDNGAWRSTIAWVPQRPHLFDATVSENIRVGRPDASVDAVRAAAVAAHADAFIAALPRGYDTRIGPGGLRLSGGQLQRLAIARAILRDARLVLLDEPTAHLDPATETAVATAIDELAHGRTLLIVSHRLWLAGSADVVAVLRAGRLVESGPPSELAGRGGAYAALLRAAAGDVDAPITEPLGGAR